MASNSTFKSFISTRRFPSRLVWLFGSAILLLGSLPSSLHAMPMSDEPSENSESIATVVPEFISKGGEIVERENSTLYLECDVTDLGEYVLLWKFNKRFVLYAGSIAIQKKPGITRNEKTNGIIIKHLTSDLVGTYTCEFSTSNPTFITYNVSMATAPVITPTPQNGAITVRKNDPLALHCNVKPSPMPVTFKWMHNSKVFEHNSTVFEIPRVQPTDSGDFICIASNEIGEKRFTFNVAVQFEPEVKVSEKIVHGPIGNDVEVTCEASAFPRADIIWQFSNNSIVHNSRKHQISNRDNISTLKIMNVDLKDYDMYYCMANNSIGSQNVYFEVTGKPSKPKFTSPQVGNNGDSYLLEWVVFSQSPILSYDLRIREINHADNGKISEWRHIPLEPVHNSGSVHKQGHELINLSQYNSYEVDIEVENEYGKTRSDIFSFSTADIGQVDTNNPRQEIKLGSTTGDFNHASSTNHHHQLLLGSMVLAVISMFIAQNLH